MVKKAILFDLDGTLIDSSEGITKAVQHALTHLGIEEPDLKKLHAFIGPPLVGSFMKHYGLTEEQGKQGVTYYREYYKPIGVYQCHLYPGAKECLLALRENGYRIGLASSKPEIFCREILKHQGVIDIFDDVTGATQDGRIATKEEVLREVLRRWEDLSKEEVCLIGDTIYDVEGANQIGISCMAVSFGFGDTKEMLAAGAVGICDDLIMLPEMLKKYFAEG